MRPTNTIYDVLNIIDECIMNNNKNRQYTIFIKMIQRFLLESEQIHFDYQIDLLNKANYILTKLYETSNRELKKEYCEMRELLLNNLERIRDEQDEE